MACRVINEDTIRRMQASGIGVGYLGWYIPWLRVKRGDFSSSGISAVVPDALISGRQHHVFSRGEHALLLQLLFSKPFDVREQYPLARFPVAHPLLGCGRRVTDAATIVLPNNRGTVAIAAECGIRHPRYRNSSVPFVMTTDFLVTRLDERGRPTLTAYSFKPIRRLAYGDRVLDLLELERRAWIALNVDWKLLTEKDVDPTVVANLVWCRRYSRELRPWADDPAPLRQPFLDAVAGARWDAPVREVLAEIASRLRWKPGLAIAMFRHCIWRHAIVVNLHNPIMLPHPLQGRLIVAPPLQTVRVGRKGGQL